MIAVGSHLDSVPGGGWLDGALGVVAALEALRAAKQTGWQEATLRLVDWADEEGVTFGHGLLGSSAATGLLEPARARELTDQFGVGLIEHAAQRGVAWGPAVGARRRVDGLDGLIELHIEQGPALDRGGRILGVPSGAVAIQRLRIEIVGRADHAGTTPFADRHDAGLAAARIALAAREVAQNQAGLATSGDLAVSPGAEGVIPGRARVSVDLRHANDASLAAMRDAVALAAREIAAEERVEVTLVDMWSFPAVKFDPSLIGAVHQAARAVDEAPLTLVSGALHDAVVIARYGIPAAMLFVRSLEGISHSPEEDTDVLALEASIWAYGVAVGNATLALDKRDENGRRP